MCGTMTEEELNENVEIEGIANYVKTSELICNSCNYTWQD